AILLVRVVRIVEEQSAREDVEVEQIEVEVAGDLRRAVDDVVLVEVEIAVIAVRRVRARRSDEAVERLLRAERASLRDETRAVTVGAGRSARAGILATVIGAVAMQAQRGRDVGLADQRLVALLHAHHRADGDEVVELDRHLADVELERRRRRGKERGADRGDETLSLSAGTAHVLPLARFRRVGAPYTVIVAPLSRPSVSR